jgi:segregation and condensation protein B
MSLKSQIEAIIYAAAEPVTVEQIADVLREVAPELLAFETRQAASPEDSAAAPAPARDPKAELKALKARLRAVIDELIAEYDAADRGMQITAVAGGYRMATRPEHHDAVRAFARSLKSPVRLSLPALETLAVIAYKQPITVPEISEIRGVDAAGVIGTLLDRKLITTAGRKQVIGRPILYKTTKEFLLRFGLKDVNELPSMEEFEKLATDEGQSSLFAGGAAPEPRAEPAATTTADESTHVTDY